MKPINMRECDNVHCLECDYSNGMFRLNKEECEQRKIFKNCLKNQKEVFVNRKNKRKLQVA